MSPDIPAPTRCFPILTRASKSGLRSRPQGVMRAGMVPEKTCDGILGLPIVHHAIACKPNHRSCHFPGGHPALGLAPSVARSPIRAGTESGQATLSLTGSVWLVPKAGLSDTAP